MLLSKFFQTIWKYQMSALIKGIKKMHLAKQQTRGFHNFTNFINMFYFIAVDNKLKFSQFHIKLR
jgi:tRNA U38,U39,U40 pseudouridine synthase TruA